MNVPPSSEPESLYKSILGWEKQKKKLVEGGDNAGDVTALNAKIRNGFVRLITRHVEFSHKQAAEAHLWKAVFYRDIEVFRKKLRHLEAKLKDGEARKEQLKRDLKESDRAFKAFLNESAAFYTSLFDQLISLHNIAFAGEILRDGVKSGVSVGRLSAEQNLALESCYKLLIYLGDLERYKGQRNNNDYSAAEKYYLTATLTRPGNGNAHNQLAVLATYRGDVFGALYCYYRSLDIENPFPTARENIKILFQKRRVTEMPSAPLEVFRQNFISVHQAHFTGSNIEEHENKTRLALEICVVEKQLDIDTLVKVVGTNWCAGMSIIPLCSAVLEKTTDWVDEKSAMPFIVTLRLLLLWLLGPTVDKEDLKSAKRRSFWTLLLKSINAFAVAASELPMRYGGGAFEEDRLLRGCTKLAHLENLVSFDTAVLHARGERVLSSIALAKMLPAAWSNVAIEQRADGVFSLLLLEQPASSLGGSVNGWPAGSESSVKNVSSTELAQYDKEMEDVLKMANAPAMASQSTPHYGAPIAQHLFSTPVAQSPAAIFQPHQQSGFPAPGAVMSSNAFTHPWQLLGAGPTPMATTMTPQHPPASTSPGGSTVPSPIGRQRSSAATGPPPGISGASPLAWLSAAAQSKEPRNPFQLNGGI